MAIYINRWLMFRILQMPPLPPFWRGAAIGMASAYAKAHSGWLRPAVDGKTPLSRLAAPHGFHPWVVQSALADRFASFRCIAGGVPLTMDFIHGYLHQPLVDVSHPSDAWAVAPMHGRLGVGIIIYIL
ncbi:MAG: hypothetical protein ACI4A8_09060 [Muribaculaceae bacterium]